MIKEVDFNGANLLAAQDNEGKIYVGVSYICNGLGFTKNQKDRQVKNVQDDFILSKGCVKFDAGVFDKNNETIAINIDFLPIWLAKISITHSMKVESEKLKGQYGDGHITTLDKLVEYQLKAKDVLAKAFFQNEELVIQDYLQLDEEERAIIYFKERKEKRLLEERTKELEPKARSFEQLISAKNNQTMNEVAKAFKTGRNRLFELLRNKGILMKDNVPYQCYIESKLFVVREYTIPDADGELISRVQTLVTGKGIEFIDKLLKQIDYNVDLYLDQYGNVVSSLDGNELSKDENIVVLH